MEQYLTEDAPVMCPKCQDPMVQLKDANGVTRRCNKCGHTERIETDRTQGLTPTER